MLFSSLENTTLTIVTMTCRIREMSHYEILLLHKFSIANMLTYQYHFSDFPTLSNKKRHLSLKT